MQVHKGDGILDAGEASLSRPSFDPLAARVDGRARELLEASWMRASPLPAGARLLSTACVVIVAALLGVASLLALRLISLSRGLGGALVLISVLTLLALFAKQAIRLGKARGPEPSLHAFLRRMAAGTSLEQEGSRLQRTLSAFRARLKFDQIQLEHASRALACSMS